MNSQTPRDLQYRMPAEWSHHAATQLHWPSNRDTWPGERLDRVEKVYLEIIETLHRYEPIHLFVATPKVKEHAKYLLSSREINFDRLIFHQKSINDVWARDCGPIFIRKANGTGSEFAITDWEYNAWGEKYSPFEDDNKLPEYFGSKYGIRRFNPDMVLEGGSIDTNGEGTLITTESVLLNPNRNPELDQNEIKIKLREFLGVDEIIWLNRGLAGDDTDGHVDDIARFLDEQTIVAMICKNPDDINYTALQENYEILSKATDLQGNAFNIETLPLPKTQIEGTTVDGSENVPASYANFYIANGVVLVPIYDDPHDEEALELFKKYFPDRDVIGIECSDLVWGQGSIHCITQQLYAVDATN